MVLFGIMQEYLFFRKIFNYLMFIGNWIEFGVFKMIIFFLKKKIKKKQSSINRIPLKKVWFCWHQKMV